MNQKPKTKLFGLLTLGSGVILGASEYLSLEYTGAMAMLACALFGCATLLAGFIE